MDDQNKKPLSTEEELDALLKEFLDAPGDEIPGEPPAEPASEPETLEALDTPWLDEVLAIPDTAPEIGPDEQAIAAAGLTHPQDAELEDIMQQIKQEDWQAVTRTLPHLPEDTEPFLDQETRDAFNEGKTLDEIFASEDTPAPASADTNIPQEKTEIPPEEEQPVPKTAPKKKNTYGLLGIPHILSTVIWLVLAVSIGAAAGRLIWICATDVLAFGREDKVVTITITEDDTLDTITEKLHKTGLIQYPELFKLYANLSHAMEDIDVGIYELNTLYDYHALVLMMSSTSNRVTVEVRIPEGYTCAQIFALLEEKGVCSAAELEEAAANGELEDYWFLEGVQRGSKYCLEGYLFPDTYEFYVGDKPIMVIEKMLSTFDYRFTETMAAKLETLNAYISQTLAARGFSQDFIDQNLMDIHKVVIVASMIEKETAATSESYNISSVIYNRLTNPGNFPYLNIDAALVYATGKTELTEEDKKLDTPYNTYLYKGLIPGPISNPSRSSLDAALDPKMTDFYFYALDPEANRHHFSKTYEEHQAFLESLKESA